MKKSQFGERLLTVFGHASHREIGEKIGVSRAAVGNYVDGRVPPIDTLLIIHEATNCNLHWLLTGEGPQVVSVQERDSALTRKLRSIAAEQSVAVFGDVDIAGPKVEERTLKLLTEFLLNQALERYGLSEGELISAADRNLAKKFSFVRDAPRTFEEQIREMIATGSAGKSVSQVAQGDDLRGIIRELVQEEISNARKVPVYTIDFGHREDEDEENVPRRKAG